MGRFRIAGALIAVITLGGAALVNAGAKWSYTVDIAATTVAVTASGATGSTRGDVTVGDENDSIGCWADVTPLDPPDPLIGGLVTVTCSAQHGGVTIQCSSKDAGIVKLAETIGTDSYIEFHGYQNVNDSHDKKNGTCTYLQVQNYSGFEPKIP
jgi:hypothetical protein